MQNVLHAFSYLILSIAPWRYVSTACCCCNNHQRCLQTPEIYSLRTLGARSPKSASLGSAELVLSGSSRRGSVSCLFQLLVADGIPWLVGHVPAISKASMFKSLSVPPPSSQSLLCMSVKSLSASLLQGPLRWHQRAHLDDPGPAPISRSLSWSHLQSLFSQISSHLQVLEIRT